VDLIRHGSWFAPLLLNLVGFAVMALMLAAWRRPTDGTGFTGRRARDVIEILAVIFVLANLPAALLEIPGGDAFYFIVAFGWMTLPLMTGELLRQAERRGNTLPARAVAGVVLVACIVGLVLVGQRQWRIIVNTEALIRTGDVQYYAGKSQRGYRVAAKKAMKELGLAGIFTAPQAVPPAALFGEGLMVDLAGDDPKTTAIYVAPTTTDYWSLTDDCDGKSLLPMASLGIPMLNGYYPDQSACTQEFALLGYAGLPADLGKPLDDTAICTRAQAMHVADVLVVEDVATKKIRKLACPAP
jgi:hypothetical protein